VTGLVCSGVAGLVHSGLGGRFDGNGCFPISSGGVVLGKMTGGLVACLAASFRLKDVTVGVGKEG